MVSTATGTPSRSASIAALINAKVSADKKLTLTHFHLG